MALWKNPTENPKENSTIIFHLYTGDSIIGVFKKDKIITSHRCEYKMYQIKDWMDIEDWANTIYMYRKESQNDKQL